ncbi:MAG: flavodoxin-dependent (E)-4-hydroxy-3-methylbut-2-enyl-diphosphate synthase [Candidatus Enteromonas sp.]|nr:flavodoxin-dependent (E)-4-hydroxy-3-methylbut-2-enyl-diphosphate synthase [Mollicutes bacterium]MDY4936043.1 flavodoxin-dependent (E)-4-hydroxy-3-methylbut-2-enyl-diphosphate synthase [Candidatus Enteromonas sp.]
MNQRELTKKIKIGNTFIGGSNRVLIQSMCNIKTEKYLDVIKQINECAAAGADLMRVSVLDENDAYAISKIKEGISIPLIADIHFEYKLALICLEQGIDAIRINPGNIGSVDKIKLVVDKAKERHVPIRVGVNSGSMDKSIFDNDGIVTSHYLYESALKHVKILEDLGFEDIVISLKGSSAKETIEAYRYASKMFKYPLHLGVTEAGPKDTGLIRSSAGLAPLLLEGIGDTIRISLSDDPIEEIKAASRLLHDLGLKDDYPTFISCPTCGRTEVDLIPTAKIIQKYIEDNHINKTIAIMGCIVNGPGEARHADLGAAGGNGVWAIFKKGKVLRRVKNEDIVEELIKEINKL